jgi:hypothetical protein
MGATLVADCLHRENASADRVNRSASSRSRGERKQVWSAKTPGRSSSAVQEAVLVVKSVQDGVPHHAAGLIEAMPLTLHLHRAMPAWNGKTGS